MSKGTRVWWVELSSSSLPVCLPSRGICTVLFKSIPRSLWDITGLHPFESNTRYLGSCPVLEMQPIPHATYPRVLQWWYAVEMGESSANSILVVLGV